MLITIILFILVLGLLVFVHELGHFLVAKKAGMEVTEFGFGFPPRLVGAYRSPGGWKMVWGPHAPADALGTVYSINLILLGGFVKIVGENADAPDHPHSFNKKTFVARFATLAAGVVMNVVLAWVLISIGFASGVPTVVGEGSTVPRGATLSTPHMTIIEVRPTSPAAQGGLRMGDEITSVDDQPFVAIPELQQYIGSRKGSTFTFGVRRGGEDVLLQVSSNANPPQGEGPTGIALGLVGSLQYPWYKAPVVALQATGGQLWSIVKGLGQLVSGGVSLNQLGGPVKIAQLTGQASELGFIYLLQFASFLSLNLAVLNALPIPALDGGRILFLVIEKIRRRAINPAVEQGVNAIGFLVLLLLMLVVTVNDFNGFSAIGRLFGK